MPVGVPSFREALRCGAEVFHALKKVLHARGWPPTSATRAASRPTSKSNTRPDPVILEAIEKAGYTPGEQIAHRPGRRRQRALRQDEKRYTMDGETLELAAGMVDMLAAWVEKYPIVSIEDGLRRGRLGRLEAADRAARRAGPAGRRRPVRHQHRAAPERRHRRGHRQLDPHQGQPDRHAHRDDRRRSRWPSAPATPRSSATAAARPRTPPSPTSRWHQRRARSRPARRRRTDRMAKYNQLLRIEEDLGDVATYPGRAAFYNSALRRAPCSGNPAGPAA